MNMRYISIFLIFFVNCAFAQTTYHRISDSERVYVENASYWKEIRLDEASYCNSSWTRAISNSGYGGSGFGGPLLIDNERTFYMYDYLKYYKPTSQATPYLATAHQEPASLFKPVIFCFVSGHVTRNYSYPQDDDIRTKGILFETLPTSSGYSSSKLAFSFEADATYFNSSRGPRVEFHFDYQVDSNTKLEYEVLYFDPSVNDWYPVSEVSVVADRINSSKQLPMHHPEDYLYEVLIRGWDSRGDPIFPKAVTTIPSETATIKTTLPFPTMVKVNIGVDVYNRSKKPFMLLTEAELLTEECVVDLNGGSSNPCL